MLLKDVRAASEEDIAWLGATYLAADMTVSRRAQILDALLNHASPAAQQAVVDHVLLAQTPLMADLQRALTALASFKTAPTPLMLDAVSRIVFDPATVPARAQAQAVREQAILAIGTLIHRLEDVDFPTASRLHNQLLAWLENNGPQYTPIARRSNIDKMADHRLVVLYALGNARMAASIPHLIRHAQGAADDDLHTTRSHRIRHAAVISLADHTGDEVEEALLQAAFYDPNIAVRRSAIRVYRSKPRVHSEHDFVGPSTAPMSPMAQMMALHREQRAAAKTAPSHSTVVDSALNLTTPHTSESIDRWSEYVSHRKRRQPARRALFGLEFSLTINMPSVGFTLPIGGDTLGAKFGLSFNAAATLYFSLLKSKFSLDLSGDAFGTLLIGFAESLIGISKIDIFAAHAAFKGNIGYDLSVMLDFDIDDITRLFNRVQDMASNLVGNFNSAVDKVKDALSHGSECDASCQFSKFGDIIATMPEIAERFVGIMANISDFAGPNATQFVVSPKLTRLLKSIYSIAGIANDDIRRMYTLVYETIHVTIPQLATNISDSVNLFVEAIDALPDCPVAATFALITVKEQVEQEIATFLALVNEFADAFYITSGQLPQWLSPSKDWLQILAEMVSYLGYHSNVMGWKCDAEVPDNPTLCTTNYTNFQDEVAVDSFLGPLAEIGDVIDFIQTTFMTPINNAFELYANLQQGWDVLKRMYDKARAIFDFLFGVKFHKTFPRVVRDASDSCGKARAPNVSHVLKKVTGAGLQSRISSPRKAGNGNFDKYWSIHSLLNCSKLAGLPAP
eukprot:m.224861 g.224861  ORF g.224861 m.224861 type:complete len:794 (-) comp16565_c0_seq1:1010-3391(-)